MPLPQPKIEEIKDEFISRCMEDDIMINEFPNNNQRLAICINLWREKKMATEIIERRAFPISELRIAGDEKKPQMLGHAAVFDSLSLDLGGFREKIAPGCFMESIAADDIRCLWNHDPGAILGRSRSGTLRLSEDVKGLKMDCDMPDTQLARDMTTLIKRGDISGMSFSFTTLSDKWEKGQDGGLDIRTLLKVRLQDVSPVTFPAYPQTDLQVAMRSLESWKSKYPDWQKSAAQRARQLDLLRGK